MIERIISTEIALYKLSLSDAKENLYGESDNKKYYRPVKIPCLIDREDPGYVGDEMGQEYTQTATFAFLRDTLTSQSIHPEIGDLINWDNEYYELDTLLENQYTTGKNPDTEFNWTDFGWDVSMTFSGHVTRRSKIQIEEVRSGMNPVNDISKTV